jgi:hypothetical protein
MSTVEVSFIVESSKEKCPFEFTVLLNKKEIETIHGFESSHKFFLTVSDEESDHVLEIVMQGKNAEHTKVSPSGEILDDILVTVKDVKIDGIELGHVFLEHSIYSHNFNGTKESIEELFAGTMGCNGIVKFCFSTPAYIWLLENL